MAWAVTSLRVQTLEGITISATLLSLVEGISSFCQDGKELLQLRKLTC